MLGCEATTFLKQIGDILLAKWKMDYGTVMGQIHARLSFTILRVTLLYVQEFRTKCYALSLVNGASIAIG